MSLIDNLVAGSNWINGLNKGVPLQAAADNAYAMSDEDLQKMILANANQQNINDWYGRKMQSDIGLQGSQSGYYNSEADLNRLKKNNPGLLGGEDAQNVALANIYRMTPTPSASPAAIPQGAPTGGITAMPQPSAMMGAPGGSSPLSNMTMTPGAQATYGAPMPTNISGGVSPSAPPQAQQMPPIMQAPPSAADLYDKLVNAKINQQNAMSNFYNNGGGRQAAATKEEMYYQNQVAADNPQLTMPDQIRAAADAYAKGQNVLPDGTPLNPMSSATERAMSYVYKNTSTAKVISAGIQANQADAELGALTQHVNPVIKDVGTTYFNRSIDQIAASFSNSPADQQKLGRIIGARSLQYAVAQLRNRIDMGEPGISATKELMDNSGQVIDQVAPRITPAARQAAQEFMNEGVEKALKARNSYGIGAASASGKPGASQTTSPAAPAAATSPKPDWIMVNGVLKRAS